MSNGLLASMSQTFRDHNKEISDNTSPNTIRVGTRVRENLTSSTIYNVHLFCLHIIPYAILLKNMTGGSSWSYSQSFNVAMYSQRQPQYMRYRRWNHRSISAVCPETKSDVPGRPRTTESVDVKNWMSCGSFPCKLEAVI